ncbi:saccharopine dehydrogenase NADP-binding domain-containing protein [Actinocatenispora rupis]|uniref:Membrane protein n=1 Tax=Actinocatenispora rupis TaxID=519421 RepID=A0A8J3NH16_9ACTN|nr:saccharopine dehydrogenase NADP-binding domain-containing protein [Actinocatenispora rupis]GID15479.1 membrane protein [Actinocatenispora rupis]
MSESTRSGEVWILGATGRIGGAVTTRLATLGYAVVPVGRDGERLRATAAEHGVRPVVADTPDRIAAEIARRRPTVVVNTIGGYAETAVPIARACLPGGHYLDLAADLTAVPRLLDLHPDAAAAGSTLVTGAGFGVLATEAVVVALCADRPTPSAVRVDAAASVAVTAGPLGPGYAASLVDALSTGGRRYVDGRLVATRLGADPRHLTLPDGQTVRTAGAPTAELLAAQRASGAPTVTATSALVPASPAVRAVLPLAGRLLSLDPVRRFAVRRLAAMTVREAPRPRRHSWGHAVVTWPDGTRREGWLRADDGMDFTAAVASEVAVRLARGDGRPGAYTPAAAFGAGLATAAGGTLHLPDGTLIP